MSEHTRNTLIARYQRLIAISSNLSMTLGLDTLLDSIVRAAADLSGAMAASILLFDEANEQLYFHSSTNLTTPLMRGLIVPVEGSIAGTIVTTREPIIVHDVRQEPRHFEEIAKTTRVETQSLLGVPLIAKDKVVGVLEAINKQKGEFNTEDQEVLTALGSQAAVAIENARLFQQSDLIADLVHELRTPLSSLTTATQLLLRPEISEEQRAKMLNTIQRETSRLSEMTSSFLDLARLESGRSQYKVEEINLPDLLGEAVEIMRNRIEAENLKLECSVPDDLPNLHGDYDKIKQVVLNLLSNAVKYNRPNGSIYLSAGRQDEEVFFSVRDTGPGILPEHMVSLFEKFYRVPGSEKMARGTGLGLSICKKIIESHGGRIEAESEAGVGTKFTVRLPLM